MTEELEQLHARHGAVADYTAVRPGLTGPWQLVQVGGGGGGGGMHVAFDVAYARRSSVRADLGIVAHTVAAVLGHRSGTR
jgi:lipopolysaccharide/colanic/teichoic acid biosynthesis glycosyltransferase